VCPVNTLTPPCCVVERMGERPLFHCQVFRMVALAYGRWQIRRCHELRLLTSLHGRAGLIVGARGRQHSGASSQLAHNWRMVLSSGFSLATVFHPVLRATPPFILSWGPLDSLSSSTSSHHGEKRPVVFLSSSISPISTSIPIRMFFFKTKRAALETAPAGGAVACKQDNQGPRPKGGQITAAHRQLVSKK